MSDNVFWVLELSIKDGQMEAFRSIMKEMTEGTKANEPQTLNYEWFISEDQQSAHIYERYLNSDAVMTHLGSFGQKYAERFLASIEPKRLMVYGTPDEEVRQALSGFGAVVMSPLAGFSR